MDLYARDRLVELLRLKERGAELPPLKSLDALQRASIEIGVRYISSHAAD